MVGLVVAAHGNLAEELVHTAEQIVGPMNGVAAVSIEPGASPEVIREQIRGAVRRVEEGEGVVVLADLFGGTPCNQSLMLCNQCQLEVVTGVNLPMLIKAHSLREDGQLHLTALAHALIQYGQKNITCASALVRGNAHARS